MIARSFVNLFVTGKINIEQCEAMLSFLGFTIPEEIKVASPKTQIKLAKQFLKQR